MIASGSQRQSTPLIAHDARVAVPNGAISCAIALSFALAACHPPPCVPRYRQGSAAAAQPRAMPRTVLSRYELRHQPRSERPNVTPPDPVPAGSNATPVVGPAPMPRTKVEGSPGQRVTMRDAQIRTGGPNPVSERLQPQPKPGEAPPQPAPKPTPVDTPPLPPPDRMPDDVVLRLIETGRLRFVRCFKKAMAADPTVFSFKVKLHVEVGPDGKLTAASTDSTDRALSSCLVRAAAWLPYPASGRRAAVDMPLFYRPE